MAAGDILKGKNLRIKIGAGTVYHAVDCSFTTSMELEGIATKDTNGNMQTPGNYEWGLSTNALVALKPAAGSQQDTQSILTLYQAGSLVAVEFTTDVAGDFTITGNCYIASCNISAPTAGSATYDVTLTGDGDFTVATVSGGGS